MFQIKCSELTGEECEFVAEAESKDEVRNKFYAHGAQSPVHQEAYKNATEEDKAAFSTKINSHLDAQEG